MTRVSITRDGQAVVIRHHEPAPGGRRAATTPGWTAGSVETKDGGSGRALRSTHAYYDIATPQWARQWPIEELWTARLTE